MSQLTENKKFKHRRTYGATIYDYKRTVHKNFDGKNYVSMERNNQREKIFCKCGNSIEFKQFNFKKIYANELCNDKSSSGSVVLINKNDDNIIFAEPHKDEMNRSYVHSSTEFEPIICNQCGVSYENYNNIIWLHSYNGHGNNIAFVKFKMFENEKSISLYNFTSKMLVSSTTSRLVCKDFKNHITFSKAKKCFYINNNKVLLRIGLRKLAEQFQGLLSYSAWYAFEKLFTPDECEKFIFEDIKKFISKIATHVNGNDSLKIESVFDKEHENRIKEKSQIHHKNFNAVIQIKTSMPSPEQTKFNVLCDKLCAYATLIMYPPISTIAFTKNWEFALKFINSDFIPQLSEIKKINPTTPTRIIEEFIKLEMLLNNTKRKRAEKRKRTLKREHLALYDSMVPKINNKKDIDFIKITKNIYRSMGTTISMDNFYKAILNYIACRAVDNSSMVKIIEKYGAQAFSELFVYGINTNITEKHIHHILYMLKHKNDLPELKENGYRYDHISIYADTIRIMSALMMPQNEIFKYKNFRELKTIHDDLSVKLKSIEVSHFNSAIAERMNAYKKFEAEINGISFKIIDSADGLMKESGEMNHCVGGYYIQVAGGHFIIFKIFDLLNGDRATMSIRTYEDKMMFEQLKSKYNKKASKRIIEACIAFLEKIKVPLGNYAYSGDLIYQEIPEQNNCEINF